MTKDKKDDTAPEELNDEALDDVTGGLQFSKTMATKSSKVRLPTGGLGMTPELSGAIDKKVLPTGGDGQTPPLDVGFTLDDKKGS